MTTRIAILGAGPSGLTLARLLHLLPSSPSTLSITIYERSPQPTPVLPSTSTTPSSGPYTTTDGGSLDLHPSTGLAAIKKCDLWREFQRVARYEGQDMRIRDKWGTCLVHIGGGGRAKPSSSSSPSGATDVHAQEGQKSGEGEMDDAGNEEKDDGRKPEIDRGQLRQILLASLPPEWVKFGTKVTRVEEGGWVICEPAGEQSAPNEQSKKKDEQREGPFDLIVGADGAWSRLRCTLLDPDSKPQYSGISGYEMEIPSPAKTCPHVDAYIGQGSMIGSSDSKMLNAQRMGDGRLKVRSWFLLDHNEDDEQQGKGRGGGEAEERLRCEGKERTLQRVLGMYEGWAQEMTELFRQAELDSLRAWTLHELPVGHRWKHRKGFTLMGDAASLATPFSGKGVNKAMTDAMELAELIGKSLSPGDNDAEQMTLDDAVVQYEQAMFPRSEQYQALTKFNKDGWFAPGAPLNSLTGMMRFMARGSDSVLVRMLGTAPVLGMLYSYLWLRQQVGWMMRRMWRKA